MRERVYRFIQQYKHGLPVLVYTIFYLTWFKYLEKKVIHPEYIIHTNVDDLIPFIPAFVIPYLLWFGYVLGFVLYFLFANRRYDFDRCCTFLITGMTLFLVISTIWPNGHHLRPAMIDQSTLCGSLVSALYRSDTPTNLWPSIHVYNSLGIHFAVMHSRSFRHPKVVKVLSGILCLSIIASTMLIKQHSAFDVATAFLLAAMMYYLVYVNDIVSAYLIYRRERQKKTRPQIS